MYDMFKRLGLDSTLMLFFKQCATRMDSETNRNNFDNDF